MSKTIRERTNICVVITVIYSIVDKVYLTAQTATSCTTSKFIKWCALNNRMNNKMNVNCLTHIICGFTVHIKIVLTNQKNLGPH